MQKEKTISLGGKTEFSRLRVYCDKAASTSPRCRDRCRECPALIFYRYSKFVKIIFVLHNRCKVLFMSGLIAKVFKIETMKANEVSLVESLARGASFTL